MDSGLVRSFKWFAISHSKPCEELFDVLCLIDEYGSVSFVARNVNPKILA